MDNQQKQATLRPKPEQEEAADNIAPSFKTIYLELGTTLPDDGIVSVWQLNEVGLNQLFTANTPIWEFLTAKQVYDLCLFDTIKVDERVIKAYFTLE